MILSLTNCTKKFRKTTAVDHISMECREGVYGLLGPNGAGKTTLLRCICGLYSLNEGTISGVGNNVGYLPQKFGLFRELTVFQMLEYLAGLKQIPKEEQKSEIERCTALVHMEDSLATRISSLSGGMLRRIGIAQAFLGDPDILLFDEPTSGLDPEERTRFKNAVASRRHKGVIMISTHIVGDVDGICDEIIIMNHGKCITSGKPEEISGLANGKVFLVPADWESQLKGDFFVSATTESERRTLLRVLSPMVQPGEKVQPNTEDGYLCAIKRY